MRTLRAVYNRAVDRHLAPYVPHHFRYVYTGTRADRKRALDKEDMERLMAKLPNQLYSESETYNVHVPSFINVYASRHSIRRPCLLEEA